MLLLKKTHLILFTGLLTLFLVVIALPATWIISGIQQAVPGLQAANINGSIWNGRAGASQWVFNGHVLPIGTLEWNLSVWSLFALNPCVTFATQASRQQSVDGELCYSLLSSSAQVNNLNITITMAQLSPFFNLDLQGSVEGSIEKATWNGQLGETNGRFLWQRASVHSGSQWIPLGDIQSQLSDDKDGGLSAQVTSVNVDQNKKPVTVDLTAAFTALSSNKPNMRVTGFINPGAQSRSLTPMLQFIGEPVSGGAFKIDINE